MDSLEKKLLELFFNLAISKYVLLALVSVWLSLVVSAPAFLSNHEFVGRAIFVLLWVLVLWLLSIISAPIFIRIVFATNQSLVIDTVIYVLMIDLFATPLLVYLTAQNWMLLKIYVAAFFIAYPFHLVIVQFSIYRAREDIVRHFHHAGKVVFWWSETLPPIEQLQHRLPIEKRGNVQLIEAKGKYCEITTMKGSHLLRISLKDAISEVSNDVGRMVHRSFWVRNDEIERLFYENGNPRLQLKIGRVIPISRTVAKSLKENKIRPLPMVE